MSSTTVRTAILNKLAADFPSEKIIDLTATYQELQDLLAENGVGMDEGWVGVDFIGNDESPITVNATNTVGKYREYGAVYIHVVDVAKLGVGAIILGRGEPLRSAFRGQNLNGVRILSVTPLSFEDGATLQFEDGFLSASFIMDYELDIDL